MVQGIVKKFYKFIFQLFKIFLHVLKFFFCLHMLPWQLLFQLVNKLRNEQSHLDSMILSNLVEVTFGLKSEINQKHIL